MPTKRTYSINYCNSQNKHTYVSIMQLNMTRVQNPKCKIKQVIKHNIPCFRPAHENIIRPEEEAVK